jgi:hypothetical protein
MSNVVCACGKAVETKPEWAGQWIDCPACGGSLYAPHPSAVPLPPKPAPPVVEEAEVIRARTRLCPSCSETIPVAAAVCGYCHEPVEGPRPLAPPPQPAPPRVDTGGVGILVTAIIGWMFCQLLCPIAWVVGAQHEADCRKEGIEPSGAAKAGRIIGLIGTIFLIIGVSFIILALALG